MNKEHIAMEIHRMAKRLELAQTDPAVAEANRVANEAVLAGYAFEDAIDFIRPELQRASEAKRFALA